MALAILVSGSPSRIRATPAPVGTVLGAGRGRVGDALARPDAQVELFFPVPDRPSPSCPPRNRTAT
ncbi:hypothetical protein RGF97_31460 [Streptomyces roseicoloratus]|uniref:Uncharacterized protein n=1 Tax=Streptomyces roseicoloratus TaxID=2508722 RepID=A0ABY9S1W2_9ACTN|nr:hypothetical protein [Streptomyces roseicoloratus]WMX48414.1 hypothetical protein RGF97_31460 [Streptomyces roseicoloratus]